MKIKMSAVGVVAMMLVGLASSAAARDPVWPLDDLREESALRAGAMSKLGAFAASFGSNPLAAEATKLIAQDKEATDPHAWIGATLRFTEQVLQAYPPTLQNQAIRQAALELTDYPIHVNYEKAGVTDLKRPWLTAVADYLCSSTRSMLREIHEAQVDKGCRVWKLYNMGFIVKTKNHTIGFDLFPSMLGNAEFLSLADDLDLLLISHVHDDHLYPHLVDTMIDAGKKVVLPGNAKELPLAGMFDLKDEKKKEQYVLAFDNSDEKPIEVNGIIVRCFAGSQQLKTSCNVYAVTMDGVTIAHNGDNSEARPYRDIVRCAGKVDVALANCWSGLLKFVEPVKPCLVIPGHENEIGHGVGARNSYLWLFQQVNSKDNPSPAIVMKPGEGLAYPACLGAGE